MSLKIPEVTSLNWIRTSTLASFKAANENQIKETEASVLCLLTLSGLQNKRNALPAWIIDFQSCGGIRRANRTTGDRLVIQVSGLPVCSGVLPQQGIFPFNRGDGAENFNLISIVSISISNGTTGRTTASYLLISNILCRKGHRALHSDHGQHLQQV